MTQQIHEEELRGLFDTADDDHRLAKVSLGRTGRMRQRHGDLVPAGFAPAHTILHDRAATGEVVLGPGPLALNRAGSYLSPRPVKPYGTSQR